MRYSPRNEQGTACTPPPLERRIAGAYLEWQRQQAAADPQGLRSRLPPYGLEGTQHSFAQPMHPGRPGYYPPQHPAPPLEQRQWYTVSESTAAAMSHTAQRPMQEQRLAFRDQPPRAMQSGFSTWYPPGQMVYQYSSAPAPSWPAMVRSAHGPLDPSVVGRGPV